MSDSSTNSGTADLEVACAIPGETPQDSVNYVTVVAPDKVAAGGEIHLEVTLRSRAATPRLLARNEVTAELEVIVGGAGEGTLTVTGLTNPAEIPKGGTVFLSGGTVTLRAERPGNYTFTPGDHTVVTSDHPVVCTVTGGSAIVARTEVA
ncbi:hypothetical protein [Solwaraspora sp. WMMD792]|uniref:hypothetical protein n=1 Tax=Micromonosporaceae TaxID=28056 RepID=UPI0024167893|nr:hypothetical protein [Solwaraspora sp. WMMD792]MDG4770700.1 hypothetical protein [Solwaraspora sp. WMMD792]